MRPSRKNLGPLPLFPDFVFDESRQEISPVPAPVVSWDEIPVFPAISIKQPWASSIIFCGKDIENRKWRTHYRGTVLIHASKALDHDQLVGWQDLVDARNISCDFMKGKTFGSLPFGGIIGMAEIVDCVSVSRSPWFVGPWGFVLKNARPLPYTPCQGALGFFQPLRAAA